MVAQPFVMEYKKPPSSSYAAAGIAGTAEIIRHTSKIKDTVFFIIFLLLVFIPSKLNKILQLVFRFVNDYLVLLYKTLVFALKLTRMKLMK